MKNLLALLTIAAFITVSVGNAYADLDGFLSGLNTRARVDMDDYGLRLSAQFGVPLPRVQSIVRSVEYPGDAFMCLQIGSMTNLPPERVLRTYKANKGKGWGVIAKDLGINPGSPAFHALKRGDFAFDGDRKSGAVGKGPKKGNGQGEGHGKGKGNGKKHDR